MTGLSSSPNPAGRLQGVNCRTPLHYPSSPRPSPVAMKGTYEMGKIKGKYNYPWSSSWLGRDPEGIGERLV